MRNVNSATKTSLGVSSKTDSGNEVKYNDVAINMQDDTSLLSNIPKNAICDFIFDGTKWILMNLMASQDTNDTSVYYGTCTSASDIQNKKVTIDKKFKLASGVKVVIRFVYGNSSPNPTLNVNNTGDKEIHYNYSSVMGSFNANTVIELVYINGYWVCVESNTYGNCKLLWEGVMIAGGHTEFYVPKEAFHKHANRVLTLMIEGYASNETTHPEEYKSSSTGSTGQSEYQARVACNGMRPIFITLVTDYIGEAVIDERYLYPYGKGNAAACFNLDPTQVKNDYGMQMQIYAYLNILPTTDNAKCYINYVDNKNLKVTGSFIITSISAIVPDLM